MSGLALQEEYISFEELFFCKCNEVGTPRHLLGRRQVLHAWRDKKLQETLIFARKDYCFVWLIQWIHARKPRAILTSDVHHLQRLGPNDQFPWNPEPPIFTGESSSKNHRHIPGRLRSTPATCELLQLNGHIFNSSGQAAECGPAKGSFLLAARDFLNDLNHLGPQKNYSNRILRML